MLHRDALRDLISRRVIPTPSERPLRDWRRQSIASGLSVAQADLMSRPPVPAAVLVPIVDRPDGLSVLLTRRAAHLPHHAGQISFPGGRLEAGDVYVVATALRESE